jgi:hypothetical protein
LCKPIREENEKVDNLVKEGYWSIATQKHLKEFKVSSSHMDEFDEISTAGKSGLFIGSIRGNGKIENIKKIEKMANLVGIQRRELHQIILPQIENSSEKQIELIRSTNGDIIGLEENVFDRNGVLEITGKILQDLNPSGIQRITVDTMDETKKIPYKKSELIELMTRYGFKEKDILFSLYLQEQYKLISVINKKNNDPIVSNEYIWGNNNQKIANAIGQIELPNRQKLKTVIEQIQNHQGVLEEKLTPIDKHIMDLAKKTGMITPTKIITSREISKDFMFSPNMLEPLSYNDDILDDVKLLLASIRFGENYTNYSQIMDSERFLRALINYGEVGPHTANSTDYTMLEKKGIVKVTEKRKVKSGMYGNYIAEGYFLELVKEDVAKEALKYLSGESTSVVFEDKDNIEAITSGSGYQSPEAMRIEVGELPQELQETEEYMQKILRDEVF